MTCLTCAAGGRVRVCEASDKRYFNLTDGRALTDGESLSAWVVERGKQMKVLACKPVMLSQREEGEETDLRLRS